jgi:hypothetical protein
MSVLPEGRLGRSPLGLMEGRAVIVSAGIKHPQYCRFCR